MPATRTILITGATGHQGGAVARALIGKGFELHCMTRKPKSAAAYALAELGCTIVQGDLDDSHSLRKVLPETWGVFAVQNTWEAGVEREEVQGKRLAELAQEAGVAHYVYSSVQSANRKTGIPHFENKFRVEEAVRALKFPSHVIIRPVFFMENLVSPGFLRGNHLTGGLSPDTPLQMIAVRDVGWFGAGAFLAADQLNGREIDIAGDAVTMEEAAHGLAESLHHPIEYVQTPMDEVRASSEDVARMIEWFETVGFNADIPALEREYGFRPTRFTEWVHQPHAELEPAGHSTSG